MKTFVSAIIVSLLPTFSFAASDNTITFRGEVTTQTCDITVNGSSASPTVLLPTVATSALASVGSTAGDTKFTIDLFNCDSSLTKAQGTFVGNNVTTNGNLGNTGTAANVSIQLVNTDDASIIDFNSSNPVTSDVSISAGSASIPLTAKYYAAGTVTAGTVIATAQYAVTYD